MPLFFYQHFLAEVPGTAIVQVSVLKLTNPQIQTYLCMHNWQIIESYVPEGSHDILKNIVDRYSGNIRLSRSRKSKWGDFRWIKNGMTSITINNDLNKDAFLVTLLHEIAHAQVYKWDSPEAKAHGKEWKIRFNNLLLPFINANVFKEEVSQALGKQLNSLKATCGANPDLLKALRPEIKSNLTLEKLTFGSQFETNQGKRYRLGRKRRTRYECIELNSGLIFAVHPLTEVKLLHNL